MLKNAKKSVFTLLLFSTLLASGCGASASNTSNVQNNTTGTNTASPAAPQQWANPPATTIDTNKSYDAIVHTNYGDFTIQLFPKDSPNTVNNFVFLAQHHFYSGSQFFRIIKTFMIQTGDPTNTGMGGPGYQFADELPPKHPYTKGMVAMANAGPNTNGSQFFICTVDDSSALQPNYTEFGQVSKGMDVVEKIASIPVTENSQGEPSKPLKIAEITSVDIEQQ